MKKYRVRAVYVGCDWGDAVVDTYEEALEAQQAMIDDYIEAFGEANYLSGVGDFCVYIEEVDA